MCGVAGFIGKGELADLEAMLSELHLRGPDDHGVCIEDAVYLGHSRLAVIDLSLNAHQPMSNEDNTIWMSFNGEIYNFSELRKELLARGHRFKSQTDAEVVIHLYEDKGVHAFEILNGMFAFAIWDKRKQLLFLVRDKMGQKPLCYAGLPDVFLFASEARALLRHRAFPRRLNLKAVAKFLFYEHVPAPDCIWEGARYLLPASYLCYALKEGTYELERYWKLRYLPRHTLSEAEALESLDHHLNCAVERHLAADVPVGVYLSGGIDSSTIAYYARKHSGGKLSTFTIAFQEETFAEQGLAKKTAELLDSRHYEIDFGADDFLKTAFDAIPRVDSPFADSSFVPAFFLNRFARRQITVALGGEGGDELFAGYPIFTAHQLLELVKRIPSPVRRRLLMPFISRLPSSYRNETWEYRMKKFFEAERFFSDPFCSQQVWLGAFGPDILPLLFKSQFHDKLALDHLFDNILYWRGDAEVNETVIDGIVRQVQAKYLPDDGLTKADRASMLNSLEIRAPFLDAQVVEWVNHVPFKLKCRGTRTKILLRKLMNGRLPADIFNGPKRGFTPPVAEWFTDRFPAKVKEVIFTEDALFEQGFVERIWREHEQRKNNHRKLLWTFFVWKLWSSVHC